MAKRSKVTRIEVQTTGKGLNTEPSVWITVYRDVDQGTFDGKQTYGWRKSRYWDISPASVGRVQRAQLALVANSWV